MTDRKEECPLIGRPSPATAPLKENTVEPAKTATRLQHADTPHMRLRPIGTIHNTITTPFLKAGHDDITMQGDADTIKSHVNDVRRGVSEIIIHEDLIDLLEDIEHYSHIMILYWADRVPEESRLLTKVHPMGSRENPKVGIFSTCSPARPNPVLTTVVELNKRRSNVLYVTGLDAVNGSPVIDIKPFAREFYPQADVRVPDWMARILQEHQG